MYEHLQLSDLLIRSSSHTPFFGIYLATHAIPDALCMWHASVGCKVKTQKHLVDHDGIENAHNRGRYSQFIDEDLIQGSTQQLEDEVASFARRLRCQLVVIDCTTPISLQGQPMRPVVERLRERTGVDVVHVDARNYEEDLYGGYAAMTATLFARQFERFGQTEAGEAVETAADEVTLLGLPFDRHEGDCLGNVAELRRLLWGLGKKARAVYLSGEPYASLSPTPQASAHLMLPWSQPSRRQLQRVCKQWQRPLLPTPVPVGFSGTVRWLREVASALGVPAARVQALVDHELTACKRQADLARKLLQGRVFSVFAEAPRLVGVVQLLTELGMVPQYLGVMHFQLGRVAEAQAMLAAAGVQLPAHVQWLDDPAPHEIRALGEAGQKQQPPISRSHVVIGSTMECDLLMGAHVPLVELGFPSERAHFLTQNGWMGFRGALHLAERVVHAVRR